MTLRGRPRFDWSKCKIPDFPDVAGAQFRHVADWPGYAVDDSGGMWSCKRERCNGYGQWHRINSTTDRYGRHRVALRCGSRRDVKLVHHLVAEAFIGPRPPGLKALHGDGNASNNAVANLRYGTQKENMRDAIGHGTFVCFGRRLSQSTS